MTTKFTPGPWLVEGYGLNWYVYFLNDQGYNRFSAQIQGGNTAPLEPTQPEEIEANARLIAAAPELLAEIEREYIELADFANDWPGRDSMKGQMKLGRLRDLIAKATGRSEQDIQDDYGTRAAIAKAKGEQQ